MGTKSFCLDLYGFKQPRNFPPVYRNFIRENGAPSLLRRDNAKDEQSYEVQSINRELYIKDGFSEPHHPHQNLVESKGNYYSTSIKFIKAFRKSIKGIP